VSGQRVKARRAQRVTARNGRLPPPVPEPIPPARPDLRRIAVVCVAVVVAATGSALLVAGRGPTVYGGRSDLLMVPAPGEPLDVRDRDIATTRELLLSRAVLVPVAARTGTTPEALRSKVSVQAGLRNDLIHLTVGDRRPARAVGLARAVTAQYLKLAGEVANGGAAQNRLDRQIARLTAQAADAPAARAAILRSRILRLQERRVELDGQSGAAPRLLSAPYLMAKPLSPRPLRALAGGLVVGLALAAAAAALLIRRARAWPA
jgi:capsular polysaccharide biosynthesis protein